MAGIPAASSFLRVNNREHAKRHDDDNDPDLDDDARISPRTREHGSPLVRYESFDHPCDPEDHENADKDRENPRIKGAKQASNNRSRRLGGDRGREVHAGPGTRQDRDRSLPPHRLGDAGPQHRLVSRRIAISERSA